MKVTLDSNNNVVVTKPLDWNALLVAISTGNYTPVEEAVFRALVAKYGNELSTWAFGKASAQPTSINVDDGLTVFFTFFDPYSATYTSQELAANEAVFHLMRLKPCENF
jgi:hypothetical protein